MPVHCKTAPHGVGTAVTKTMSHPAIYSMNPPFMVPDFFGSGAPQWNALESEPQASLIKKGRLRNVWRVALPHGQSIIAKVFDDDEGSFALWFKRLLRIHPAMREWAALMWLQARGVPAARPIALAKYPPSKDAASAQHRAIPSNRLVLLTEGIANAADLVMAWNAVGPSGTDRLRSSRIRTLIAAVAELWARAHQRGYSHPDGHPGNVLVENASAGESAVGRALFIDPAWSVFSSFWARPVSNGVALHSLAMLDQYFHRTATRADRLRFWRDYWVRREILLDGKAERRFLHRLTETAAAHRTALARQRDRRMRGDGKYFGRIRLAGGWIATVVLQLERRHVFSEPEVPDRNFVQWASFCTQALRMEPGSSLSMKGIRMVRRPIRHRGSWAARLFRHAHRLRHRDIPAPLVLGCLEKRGLFGIVDEYLVLPSEGGWPEP